MLKSWLGHAAAELLVEMVKPETTVAVSWGTTLRAMTDSLAGEQPVEGVKIVPLAGGLHRAFSGTNSHWVAEQIGRYFRAPAQVLYAPLFVEDRTTAEALARDPDVRDTLDLARRASSVIFSVGTLNEGATLNQLGYLSPEEQAFLQERGAVGDIACRWIDAEGNTVEPPPTINPISISLEELKGIPERLTVAGGELKREALLGALRGGFTTTLVTDEGTAAYLLERAGESSMPRLDGRGGESSANKAHALTGRITANDL
jgi:DNA-binding transcriptional regulator LsrR (DeoR family)